MTKLQLLINLYRLIKFALLQGHVLDCSEIVVLFKTLISLVQWQFQLSEGRS